VNEGYRTVRPVGDAQNPKRKKTSRRKPPRPRPPKGRLDCRRWGKTTKAFGKGVVLPVARSSEGERQEKSSLQKVFFFFEITNHGGDPSGKESGSRLPPTLNTPKLGGRRGGKSHFREKRVGFYLKLWEKECVSLEDRRRTGKKAFCLCGEVTLHPGNAFGEGKSPAGNQTLIRTGERRNWLYDAFCVRRPRPVGVERKKGSGMCCRGRKKKQLLRYRKVAFCAGSLRHHHGEHG